MRVAVAILFALVPLALPSPARAHCDALDGPVVNAARAALAAGDPAPALAWVGPEQEAELRAAFERTRAARAAAPELADLWFFETTVRLHRAYEGAAYTGLKPAGTDPGPAVRAADAALSGGDIEALVARVAEEAAHGLRHRYAHARETRKAGGREAARAYVDFVHYVVGLHEAVEGGAPHAE